MVIGQGRHVTQAKVQSLLIQCFKLQYEKYTFLFVLYSSEDKT